MKCQIHGLADVVYDALNSADDELIRGLQSFSVSLWSWTIAGAAIMSYVVRRTVEERKKKIERRREVEEKNIQLDPEERIRLYDDRIWISFQELRHSHKNINTVKVIIKGLEVRPSPFIEVSDENPPGYEHDPRGVFVSLTPVWNLMLERLERNEKETNIFSESIGKLLTLSILRDMKYACCGVRSYKPIALLASKVPDDKTEITMDEIHEIYDGIKLPRGTFYQMMSYDGQKDPGIRLIKANTGKGILLTRHAIRAYSLIRQRGLQILRGVR
jgi:hypothetical protein